MSEKDDTPVPVIGASEVKLTYKPGSVQGKNPLGQSFLWAASCPAAQAAYPGAARAALSLPYLALLRMGFGVPSLLPGPRWALTPPFHHRRSRERDVGRLLSVPLSVASRRPAVSRHPALRSPDFPLCGTRPTATAQSASRCHDNGSDRPPCCPAPVRIPLRRRPSASAHRRAVG